MNDSIFDYGGVYQITVGALRLVAPPSTPQRLQDEYFSGVDGATALYHGNQARPLVFEGIVSRAVTTTLAAAYDGILTAIANIQSRTGITGTLLHYVGPTYETYLYSRLEDYRRAGSWGYGPNGVSVRVQARFRQLYW